MSGEAMEEVIVVGAGVAGLACARELSRSGMRPVVLEKGRGVGGRCATRRVEDQRVDHGILFLHGVDPEFVADVEAVDSPRIPGWPVRVEGTGPPCQPDAFSGRQRRWAFPAGVTAFPKHLARGLDVRLNTRVREIRPDRECLVIRTGAGEALRARTAVLAMPLEQTAVLLEGMDPAGEEMGGLVRMLRMMSTMPCLALLAGYPMEAPAPPWDVSYPEDSPVLQLVSHDSAKRPAPRFHCLVFQARPRWSRDRLEAAPEAWGAEILKEAERRLGPWAGRPAWVEAHRWRYARLETGNELAGPVLCELEGGVRLGLAGEVFSPGGGVEAAWASGRRLGRRILEKGEAR